MGFATGGAKASLDVVDAKKRPKKKIGGQVWHANYLSALMKETFFSTEARLFEQVDFYRVHTQNLKGSISKGKNSDATRSCDGESETRALITPFGADESTLFIQTGQTYWYQFEAPRFKPSSSRT